MKIPESKEQLLNCTAEDRNKYGDLDYDVQLSLGKFYPELKIVVCPPDKWLTHQDAELALSEDKKELCITKGSYSGAWTQTSITAIESDDYYLNLKDKPLFLLKGTGYNPRFNSLTFAYYLFGQNENQTYFLHKIKPAIAKTNDLNACRQWIWNLKPDEQIIDRQGDLAFIAKDYPQGQVESTTEYALGNHLLKAEVIRTTKHKVFVYNPRCTHHEHDTKELLGWYEVRMGRAWKNSNADSYVD